jgi:hypothetical protein
MLCSKLAKHGARLALAVILGLALVSFWLIPVQAQTPVDLVLGGPGATSWNISNIKPSDSGTKTVELHNTGLSNGAITIWISDINETDYAGDGAALDDYLLFNPSCSRLNTNITLPARIRELPPNVSAPNYIKITPVNAGETVTLIWQWQFRETGQPQNNAQGDSLSFTINYVLEESPAVGGGGQGGEGGGGGGGGEVFECPAGEISTTGKISGIGLVIQPFIINSFDGRLSLILDQGTAALDIYGSCFSCIGINKMVRVLYPPEDAYVIGVMYDVDPDGATFTPAATLRYSYLQSDLPEGIDEKTLFIAYYDNTSGKWIKLDSIVDTQANIITAKISRFNDLAIFGYKVAVPPPAAFQISSLSVSPTEVKIGEAVNISVLVTNTGGQPGSYQVILKINGVAEADKQVVLAAGASEPVSFTISKEAAGTYSVDVNGLTGAFGIKQEPAPVTPAEPMPTPAKPISWWLIGAIIGGVVGMVLILLLVRRRASKRGTI